MMHFFDPWDAGPPMTQERWSIQRQFSGSEKLELCLELGHIARVTLEAQIRFRHPNYTEEQVMLARNRYCWGDDLTREVYPDKSLLPV